MENCPKQIEVAPGTHLNYGLHEDSDFVVVQEPIMAEIAGPYANGAIPVRILEDGKAGDEVLFFHQPEPPIFKYRR